MKLYSKKYMLDYPIAVTPMGEINGYRVRPGMFDVNGATALADGVNFTIHTHCGTSCELLLFHRNEEEPYAVLPFPEAYKIGDVYSMIVFGLNIEEFEYAYHARVVHDTFDREDMEQSKKEMSDLVIYELHVRGFTQHPSSGVKHKGTFAGLQEGEEARIDGEFIMRPRSVAIFTIRGY